MADNKEIKQGSDAPEAPVTPAATPTPAPTAPRTNRLGLLQTDYKAAESTLCAGCGHDAITAHIIKACFELGVDQHKVAKLSGIGCSSKTPSYFLGRAHGFNSVHGRMPSVATGVSLANRTLTLLGVSGDGDTASIGIGQFVHIIRRNAPMVYIIENNGVYGLTKGQFSATADVGSRSKGGVVNELPPVDLCSMALDLGATFVARSFSGDPKQMVPLLKAALSHNGTAIIDVISPCVTFNDHDGSTKSHKSSRDAEVPLHGLGFVPFFEQITADYEPGTVREVTFHDGSKVVLKKLDTDYDPTDRDAAMLMLMKARRQKQFLTGLFYVDTKAESFNDKLDLPATPLVELPESVTRPSAQVLTDIMASLM
jgi:2-oxoglutarate/2-oxoacid ferredoxin oxidoreductase subunit beta